MKDTKERQRLARERGDNEIRVSRRGSRNGWWMGHCPTHGATSFNTIVGCERCAREREAK